MIIRLPRPWLFALAIGTAVACSNETSGPSTEPPAAIAPTVSLARTGSVGSAVDGGIAVKGTDAKGRPVVNASVALAVTQGNGSTNPRVALTDANGLATATWTLGTILGPNAVTATVTGVATPVTFTATGTPGAVANIAITPASARLLANVDTLRLTAVAQDAFGNATTAPPTFLVRDPTLLSVDASGLLHALRRGGATYVIVTAAPKTDSILVTVLAAGQSICTAAASPLELAVGQVVTGLAGQGICVHAATAGAEYTLVPFYDAGVPSATISLQVLGQGLTPLALPVAAAFDARPSPAPASTLTPDYAFEARLRDRERAEATSRAAAIRSGQGAHRDVLAGSATTAPVVPNIGDLLKINVNSQDYCNNPDMRTGRVAAVTDKAIVVADTGNPAGGFTDAEYRSIGVTFDTLVDPVDRAAFGAVTDIDNNGHVILFFTRAVNELTTQGASSVVLGFFYSRDLLPKSGPPGPCSGSNVGEMFYLMVPDVAGVVNGNQRPKAQIVTLSNGTVAHEYQHLINASRRLYVNGVGAIYEEKWLDEGLAHVAEELNFFRAAGASPRANIDAGPFADIKFATAYSTFESNNFKRYATYLQRTETQAPTGSDAFDDDLQTRGAVWNFLRYAADHQPAGQENAFWFKLVNSTTTGVANLTAALGGPPNSLFRDWAISVFLDDDAPNVDQRFLQPSWNMRSALTGGSPATFGLFTRVLSDNVTSNVTLVSNGVSFLRFSVPSGKDALLTVLASGQPVSSTVQLALVRVR